MVEPAFGDSGLTCHPLDEVLAKWRFGAINGNLFELPFFLFYPMFVRPAFSWPRFESKRFKHFFDFFAGEGVVTRHQAGLYPGMGRSGMTSEKNRVASPSERCKNLYRLYLSQYRSGARRVSSCFAYA